MSNSTHQDSWDYCQIFFLSKGRPWSTRFHLWNWPILTSKQQRDASSMSFQSLSKVILSQSKMRINSKQTENSTISEKLNLGEKKWYKEMNLKGRILRVRNTLVRDERVRRDESCEETDRGCGGGSGLEANQTTGSWQNSLHRSSSLKQLLNTWDLYTMVLN